MMRLTDQLDGTGPVFERDTSRGEVRYHVRVYQQYPDDGRSSKTPLQRIEGAVIALSDSVFDPIDVWRRGADLTLRLEDGRVLEFQLSSSAGTLIATSRIKSFQL